MSNDYLKLNKEGRGSGKTTDQLIQLANLLYNGPYRNGFYVIHHHDFARYCMQLLSHHSPYDVLYEPARNRLHFYNKGGNRVSITFVTYDREWEQTVGFRDPIARDHHVFESHYHAGRQFGKLEQSGTEPWASLYIPKEQRQ